MIFLGGSLLAYFFGLFCKRSGFGIAAYDQAYEGIYKNKNLRQMTSIFMTNYLPYILSRVFIYGFTSLFFQTPPFLIIL